MGLYFNHTIFYGHLVWRQTGPPSVNPDSGLVVTPLGGMYYAIHRPGQLVDLGELDPTIMEGDAAGRNQLVETYKVWISDPQQIDDYVSRMVYDKRRPGPAGLVLFEGCCCTLSNPPGSSVKYIDM